MKKNGWFFAALFCALLIIFSEIVWQVGYHLAPDYPKIINFPQPDGKSTTTPRKLLVYKMPETVSGSVRLDFFGSIKDEGKDFRYGLLAGDFCETLTSGKASLGYIREKCNLLKGSTDAFRGRGHVRYEGFVNAQEKPGFVIGYTGNNLPSNPRLFLIKTNLKDKLAAFFPYIALAFRNFFLGLFFLFLGALFYKKEIFWRRLLPLLGLFLFLLTLVFLPDALVYAAFHGSRATTLLDTKNEAYLLNENDPIKYVALSNAAPYRATLLTFLAGGNTNGGTERIFCDLAHGRSYDDQFTENVIGLGRPELIRRSFVFDSVHAFFKSVSLRFWLEDYKGNATITGVTLKQANLPPLYLKVILGAGKILREAFFALFFGALLSWGFFVCLRRGGFLGRLAVTILCIITLSSLFAPPYLGGVEEPFVRYNQRRIRAGLWPLSRYLLFWRSVPTKDVVIENGKYVDFNGSLLVADCLERNLGVRTSLVPDYDYTYLSFYTRWVSDIRISFKSQGIELENFKLLRVPGSLLIWRVFCWIWLFILIGLGLSLTFRFIVKGEKA